MSVGPKKLLENVVQNRDLLRDATRAQSLDALFTLVGPAMRGFILQRGKHGPATEIPSEVRAYFDWEYAHDQPELRRLFQAAKKGQWDSDTKLPWDTRVDPLDPGIELLPDDFVPMSAIPAYRKLPVKEQRLQRQGLLAWSLSQFLHGEQGALYASCQVTQSIQWFDGKLFGSTQVMDEGRHVEVFQRYLLEKLEKLYPINDNLYVIIDALIGDARWDLKFLGMQIMIEGLALGSFGVIREKTQDPLLRELLKYVILDEGRHVHYGVVALQQYYTSGLDPRELREREDWAFEISVLLRNRFLAHEFYDEYYAHSMSRAAWDALILESEYMRNFRDRLFKRLIPNLKRINLMSARIRPHYEALGLLAYEHEKAAPELTAADLVGP